MDNVIVPVESTYLPASKGDGALRVESDLGAVREWLSSRAARSADTRASYEKEALRLLVWLESEGLTINTMKKEDASAFLALLEKPTPAWIRPKKIPKDDKFVWRQLLKKEGLSPSSLGLSRRILAQLFTYLQDAEYVSRNVFRLTSKPNVQTSTSVDRLLDLDAWQWLSTWLKTETIAVPRGVSHHIRNRWVMHLLYHTGIRRAEAANGSMADFVRRDGKWSLKVIGKGNKVRYVTANSALMEELVAFRQAMNLAMYPNPTETLPLVPSINARRADKKMTPRAVGFIVNQVAEFAAAACQDQQIKSQLEEMSTHFLRHTNASHRMAAGSSIETTQDELGHSSMATTRIYIKVLDSLRREDSEKLVTHSLGVSDGATK